MRYASRMLWTLLACATPGPGDSTEPAADTADSADTGEVVAPPLSAEVSVAINPHNPLSAIVTVTPSLAATAWLEFGPVDLDRSSPTVALPAGEDARLLALGLTPDSTWSVQVVLQTATETWRSEVVPVQTAPVDATWSCTPSFLAPESDYSHDEVVCGNLTVGGESRMLCWDRWGAPRLSLHTEANDQLLSMVPLPEGGWVGTSQNRSALVFMDAFGAVTREYGASWFSGQTRFEHTWVDAHELHPVLTGTYAGAVAFITGSEETLDDGRVVGGAGFVLFDPDAEQVLYDYSFLGDPTDGVSADPLLPFTREGTEGLGDWTHANGLAVGVDDEGEDFVVVSLLAQNWLVKVRPATDELEWRLGFEGDFALVEALGADEPVPLADTDWQFHQHQPSLVERNDGALGLFLFDNGASRYEVTGGSGTNYSRVLELAVDEVAGEAAIVFQHGSVDRSDADWFYSANRGSVQALPDDRLVFTLGDDRQVREISYPDGEARWSLQCPTSAEPMQRIYWMSTLYDAGWTDTAEEAEEQPGLEVWVGDAVVDDAYRGVEARVVLADGGLGDAVCRIEYAVESTAERADCADCLWAYDVTFGAATVVEASGCADAGIDVGDTWEGTTRAYGVALDYLGHSHALMMESGGTWAPMAFASWDEATGVFGYRWEQGYVP